MKILFVTKNWVGDILFEFPAIEAVKHRYPDSEIVCMAPERCRELLENHPEIDRVILFDEKGDHRSLLSKIKTTLLLRKEKFDQAYLFHRSRTRALMLLLAGVKERIGYDGKRSLLLTQAVKEPEPIFHQVDYFLQVIKGAGLPYPDKGVYRYYFNQAHRENIGERLKKAGMNRFVCFHLGANWEPKRWPTEHFAELARLLDQKWKIPVIVTGAKTDQPLLDQMKEHLKGVRVISWVGQTSLGELGALYEKALFMVSADSGPMHIAAGVGCPVVTLFGPTDPDLTGPRGIAEELVLRYVPEGYHAPWYGEVPREGWMVHIRPETVLEKIEKRKWQEADPQARNTNESVPEILYREPPKAWTPSEKRILIITLSNIGDVILTTPAIMAVAKQFPEARLTVVVGPKAFGVLKKSPHIHRLIVYDKQSPWSHKWRMIQDLRRTKYDSIIDLKHTLIPYLVPTKHRGPAIRHFPRMAAREKHLRVLEKAKIPCHQIPPFVFFDKDDETSFLGQLKSKGIAAQKDWIMIAPVAASEHKTWSLEGFHSVVERLVQDYSADIFLVGDNRERAMMDSLTHIHPTRVHNFAGKMTLNELAFAVSRCGLLLTNDSAVMHLGFEYERPVVALFGPTDEKVYGRTGASFRILRGKSFEPSGAAQDKNPFGALDAQTVYQTCKELLGESARLSQPTS